MTANSIDWDEDLPSTPAEEYQALIRALRRTEGFGIIFVRCNDADEETLIRQVKADLPQKTIDQLQLTADSTNFYEAVETLPNREQINILFVRGLKHSLYDYEQTKRVLGWTEAEVYSYSWKGVPKILANLNQQRDRLRDDFNICFVFLLPLFAIKYLIHRAPDFYDWRSGIFEFPLEKEAIDREYDRVQQKGNYDEYFTWTYAERYRKIAEMQDLIVEPQLSIKQKVLLLGRLASFAYATSEHKAAFDNLDELLKLQPENYAAWCFRGSALISLERYVEAIDSYNKALDIKPDNYEAWDGRGLALSYLEQYEEAIDSYNKALDIKPDAYKAWYSRGIILAELKHYKEAINSYNKALDIKPDWDRAWGIRGIALAELERYEEAISSWDKELKIKPDRDETWYNRGLALAKLGRHEEAIYSYTKALDIKPSDHQTWYMRGLTLVVLGRLEEASSSYDKALAIKSDLHEAWYAKAKFYLLWNEIDEAIQCLRQVTKLNPKYRELARTDSLFNRIRSDDRFKALIEESSDQSEAIE